MLVVAVAVTLIATASRLRTKAIAERPLLATRFDHGFHRTVNCTTCHHNFVGADLGAKRCLPCHKAYGTSEATRIDVLFHGFCTDCHRQLQAEARPSGPVKACAACHVENKPGRFLIDRRKGS